MPVNGYSAPREKGDFNNVRPLLTAMKRSQTSRLTLFHLIPTAGKVRSSGTALTEAINEDRSVLQQSLFSKKNSD